MGLSCEIFLCRGEGVQQLLTLDLESGRRRGNLLGIT